MAVWIELDGQYFNSELVAVVRRAGEKKSAIFLSGSSPVDGGFLVSLSVDEVMQAVREARLLELAGMIDTESGPGERDHYLPVDAEESSLD